MKTNTLFFFLVFLIHYSGYSQITKKELLNYSNTFISEQHLNDKVAHTPIDITDLKNTDNSIYAYVVNLKPKGFIVFSPSKNLFPVISFSTESNFDYKDSQKNTLLQMIKRDLNHNLKELKNKSTAQNQSKKLKNNNLWSKTTVSQSATLSTSATPTLIQYGPHFSNVWGGVNCHDDAHNNINVGNYYTPNNYSPGCVATTLSMALRYYNWPETGVGSHTNVDNQGSSQTSWSANFGNATYDYANMLDEYHHAVSNLTEQKAMGYLAFHCATALDMDYEASGSTSNINRIPAAAGSYFRFSGHHQYSSWSNFWPRMHQNIQNGHPVPVAIDGPGSTGHAPAVDGYRYTDGDPESEYYYHLNMGWYGTSNAWYRLQSSFSAGGYTSISAAVFDLLPEPIFTTNSFTATNKTFVLNWKTSSKLDWDAFELQESTDDGVSYTTISNSIIDTTYTRTVSSGGSYKYRVRSKVDGAFYANSYSNNIAVNVPYDFTYLDFDGNDSFFVYDNSSNDLDVSNTYTIETWIKIDSRSAGTYPVVFDRKTVFSLYLIADSNADYAVKFVSRNSSGTINASVQSDASTQNLSFGSWAHIAVSRTSGTLKLYVNGEEVSTSSDSDFSLSASTNALNVGARYWSGYERYLDGKIDKIRITDDAKHTSNFTPDLKTKYSSDGNTKMLISLDEGSGTSLADDANNFNTVLLRSSPNQPSWMFDDESIAAFAIQSISETVMTSIEPNTSSLYPNPATNIIYQELTLNSNQKVKFSISDIHGRILLEEEKNLISGFNKVKTNISSLPSGFYIAIIQSLEGKTQSKFFKK